MIIFINISKQIDEDENAFCFYNTIDGKIFSFWGSNVFHSAEEFIEETQSNFEYAKNKGSYTKSLLERKEEILRRCVAQIPKSFYTEK